MKWKEEEGSKTKREREKKRKNRVREMGKEGEGKLQTFAEIKEFFMFYVYMLDVRLFYRGAR